MRTVIYTSIVGGYDSLRQPEVVDPSFDYICFSDDFTQSRIGVWEIRPIPFDAKDNTRRSRFAKILPHKVLADYDASVWMDANITVKSRDFYDAVLAAVDSGSLVAQVPHLGRDCVYDEISRCYKDMRLGFKDARHQWRHLREEGFPEHLGLFENNLIFRKHNDLLVKKLSEEWWEEYMSYSSRDQLALMPVYWRNSFMPDSFLGEGINVRNASCLEIFRHPSAMGTGSLEGLRRLPLKVAWTWRKWVSRVYFQR